MGSGETQPRNVVDSDLWKNGWRLDELVRSSGTKLSADICKQSNQPIICQLSRDHIDLLSHTFKQAVHFNSLISVNHDFTLLPVLKIPRLFTLQPSLKYDGW